MLATQNPIEQEGTYPLAEAQVDRFLLKLVIGYPSRRKSAQILDRMLVESPSDVRPVLDPDRIVALQRAADASTSTPRSATTSSTSSPPPARRSRRGCAASAS